MRNVKQQQDSGASGPDKKIDVALLNLAKELGKEIHLRPTVLESLSLKSSLDKDLGLDSLTRMELLSRIERKMGVRLPESVFAEIGTLGDLKREILKAAPAGAVRTAREVSDLQLETTDTIPSSLDTLVEVLEWHVDKHPDRPHIKLFSETGEGEVLTFADLSQEAKKLASGLQQKGLGRGDTVAIMLPTGKDYFFSFFGVLLAGGVPVSLYPPARPALIEDHLKRHQSILENCKASILIAFPEARTFTRLLKAHVPSLSEIVTLDDLAAESKELEIPLLVASDTAFLQYTSGSTGNPKGVILTHANLLANVRAMGETINVRPEDVIVSWLPLYHDMGLIGTWLGSLYYSCLFVVMSPTEFLARPERWLWAIHRYRSTLSPAPNFAFELCLKRIADEDIENLDLSSWRAAFNGAEAVSPQTVREFTQRFSKYGFKPEALMPVYGLAENSVGLTFPPLGRAPIIDRIDRESFTRTGRAKPAQPEDSNALEFVACGRPLIGHEIRIIDDTGREVPTRQEGRLEFRGPSATSGYFDNPEKTEQLFHNDWLDTGDRAYLVEGDIYITGRIKDIVIHGGRNLYPEELEEEVGDIEGIRKGCVAVFGSKDAGSGSEQLIVLAETRETDVAALEKLESRINMQAVDLVGSPPDKVILAPPYTVLKTSSGKIRRSANRDQYEKGQLGKGQRSIRSQIARLLASSVVPETRRTIHLVSSFAYAFWFWLLFGLFTPVVWLTLLLTPSKSWRWGLMRMTGKTIAFLSGIKLEITGLENLLETGKPCVFVANHSSYLDVFAIVTGIPRTFGFVSKAELAERFFTRILCDRIEVEYVERIDRQKGMEAAERLVSAARKGKSLFFFPEGTFTRIPGVYPFHTGAFMTAVSAGLPVIPIAIKGSRSVLHPSGWFPRKGAITLIIGPQIESCETGPDQDRSIWEQAQLIQDKARSFILDHCGEPDLPHERAPIW